MTPVQDHTDPTGPSPTNRTIRVHMTLPDEFKRLIEAQEQRELAAAEEEDRLLGRPKPLDFQKLEELVKEARDEVNARSQISAYQHPLSITFSLPGSNPTSDRRVRQACACINYDVNKQEWLNLVMEKIADCRAGQLGLHAGAPTVGWTPQDDVYTFRSGGGEGMQEKEVVLVRCELKNQEDDAKDFFISLQYPEE